METKSKRIEVVAGLIFRRGKILACQRGGQGPFPLKWEFPGGKVEKGEAYGAALHRELREELGIKIGTATPVLHYQYGYPGDCEVQLHFFRICDYQGEIKNLVFKRLSWLAVDDLEAVDFLEGDLPLVEFLRSSEAAGLWGSV
jgi:8-oxo-dGTP diphosphatase